MIAHKNTILSEAILEKRFVCNLKSCKGICCVEGESGAPLADEETGLLDEAYENIKPFLRPEGIASINAQGKHIIDKDGDKVTPLVNGNECAYTVFEKDGKAACGIEKAWKAGKTNFRKPISCHLYPIRIKKLGETEALNYQQWEICDNACILGEQLNVKVYEFVKDALIRKFGEDWYNELTVIDAEYEKYKTQH